ncbi:MAG: hypothetical protein AAGB22_02435 [Bacteroidota bacterium]
MEKFWLVAAILSLAYALYSIGRLGFAQGSYLLIMPLLAGFLYSMRRFMRRRIDDE